jgi:hypothetical protein
MVIDKDWDHVRRFENAVQVLSLSDSLLRQSGKVSVHISLFLTTHAQLYFKRVSPLSALKFKEMKNPRIDVTKRADLQIDLDGLRRVEVLGGVSFGVPPSHPTAIAVPPPFLPISSQLRDISTSLDNSRAMAPPSEVVRPPKLSNSDNLLRSLEDKSQAGHWNCARRFNFHGHNFDRAFADLRSGPGA